MAKDINIHVKTTGADEAKKQLEGLSGSAKDLGSKIDEGQQTAGRGIEATTSKLSVMDRVFNRLRSQVIGFITGWLGLQAVMKLVDYFIGRLEKIKKIQEDIYQKSLSLGEIGQGLAVQLGQPGQQRYWTQQALKIQQAGGLASTEVAAQMLVSMDVAFAKAGGIKAPGALNIAGQLAPFIGAMQLKPEQVQTLFGLAGQKGIAPTAPAYKEFFNQLYAASQMTKTRDIGQFITQLSKDIEEYEKSKIESQQRAKKAKSPRERAEILAAVQPTEAMVFMAAAKGAIPIEVTEDYLTTIITEQRAFDAAIAGEKLKRDPEAAKRELIRQVKTAEEKMEMFDVAMLPVMERWPTAWGEPIEYMQLPKRTVIINYDSHVEFNPIVGGKAERGMEPPIESGVQP